MKKVKNSKRFLVRYVEDGIYYVCSSKSIRKYKTNKTVVKWIDLNYYPAEIVTSGNARVLLDLCRNLNAGYPKVLVQNLRFCIGENFQQQNFIIESESEADINTFENNQLVLFPQDEYFDDSSIYSSIYIDGEIVIHPNIEISSCNQEVFLLSQNCEEEIIIENLSELNILKDNVLLNLPHCDFFFDDMDSNGGNLEKVNDEIISDGSKKFPASVAAEEENEIILLESNVMVNADLEDSSIPAEVLKHCDVNVTNSENNDTFSNMDEEAKVIRQQKDPVPKVDQRNVLLRDNVFSRHQSNLVHIVDQRDLFLQTSKARCKKYYCNYCQKMVTNFGRHLMTVHESLDEVKLISRLPKKNPVRIAKLAEIRVKAQFIHNTKENSGSLVLKRRPNEKKKREALHYKHCPACGEMFSKLSLRKHYMKCGNSETTCTRRFSNIFQESKKKVMNVHHNASNRLIKDVLSFCKEDVITNAFLFDELCILYGNKLAMRFRDDRNNSTISQRLREMGRFIHEFQKTNPSVATLYDILDPLHYDDIVRAINKIAGLNEEDGRYRAPSTAYNLGLHIKFVTELLESECIKKRNMKKREQVRDLLCLMKEGFSTDINKTVSENQVENRRLKNVIIPSKEDVASLHKYVSIGLTKNYNELKTVYSYKNWKDLAGFILIKTQLFNRRRAGEIELIKIKDFNTFKFTDLNEETIKNQSPTLKNIARDFGRFFIRGKLNRTVPVILDRESVDAINLILSHRDVSGVSAQNPYVFVIEGRNNYSHLGACNLMRLYSEACGAQNPAALRGTELRKQMATRCSIFKLFNPLVERLANHLGHSLEIHKNIYRQPEELEVPEIVPILKKCLGMEDSDSDEDIENNNTQLLTNGGPSNDPLKDPEPISLTNLNLSANRYSTTSVKRVSWSSPEKEAINSSFEEMIEYGIVPTYEECHDLREKYPCLEKRTPPQIKSFVAYATKKRKTKEGNKNNCRKPWSTPERHLVRTELGDFIKKKKLPSLKLCATIIKKHAMLSLRKPEHLKAFVNNVIKKEMKYLQ